MRFSASQYRYHRGGRSTLDKNVSIDWSKGPRDNLKTILLSITKKDGITIGQRLSYLSFFSKFCRKLEDINVQTCGFTMEEIFCCLRVTLFHESADVRAAGLRSMRYLLKNEFSVTEFYRTNMQLLVARSLDIELNNFPERIQSLRLIRRLLALKPDALPEALSRSIIAIARDGHIGPDKDRMRDACMGCLSEITLLNPQVASKSGGISALLDCILMSHESHHISEALISCILYVLNDPRLRCHLSIDVDLRQFIAPFTDYHYSIPLLALNTQRRDDGMETAKQRENRLNAAKIALVSIFRSWPGLFALCKVGDNSHAANFNVNNTDGSQRKSENVANDVNGLCSLIEMLNLPYREIRKQIMELIFELFYLTIPNYTSDFEDALESCNPTSLKDSWHLQNGFVASEGKSLLPHIAKQRHNLLDNYQSLLLYTFLTNGLLDGLVSVITVPSDPENSVRAIILVGELLHLSSQLLPSELAQRYYTLPKLIETALSPDYTPEERNIAKAAITCLNHMHNKKKHQTIPHSLYLNQIIHFYNPSHRRFHSPRRKKSEVINLSPSAPGLASIPALMASASLPAHLHTSLSSSFSSRKESINEDATLASQIRESRVLKNDPNKWDWYLISCALRSSNETFKRLEDSNYRLFIKKIIHYFKPSSKFFSKLRADDESGHEICTVGCYLVDFLIEADEPKTGEYISDFLNDICCCILQITGSDSNYGVKSDAILNSHNTLRTWSHAYFLFIGRFTGSSKGGNYLEKAKIYQSLLELIQNTTNENYFKLIVSSINYSKHISFTRSLLAKILSCDIEAARLYATKYLRVLLRLGSEDSRDWALELLSQRLSDDSQAVVLAAIDILDEACDKSENLEALINLRPPLLHVGDRGLLLLLRYLSSPTGFKFLRDTNFLNHELQRWKDFYNSKYVKIVEDSLNEALSVHQRNENGAYGRRSDKKYGLKKTVLIPAHLYGELVKQDDGYNLVVRENYLGPLCQTIKIADMHDEIPILQLKAALWAIGSVGSSLSGFQLVVDMEVIPAIVRLASDASVLSIRGTCFYVLGLLASTENGANFLKDYGWQAVRHTSGEKWPLSKEMIGANIDAGLFLYPMHGKREYTWSVSSASTRMTDLCAVFSGKIKSLDPANSFVFNEEIHQKNAEDIFSLSFSNLEAHNLFDQMKSLSLKANFPYCLPSSSKEVGIENQPTVSDELRPRSSSECDPINYNINASTPETAGLWMNDDQIRKKHTESHYDNSNNNNQSRIAGSPKDIALSHDGIAGHRYLRESINLFSSTTHKLSQPTATIHGIASDHVSGHESSAYLSSIGDDLSHRKIPDPESVSKPSQSRSLTDYSHQNSSYYETTMTGSHRESFFKRSVSHDTNSSHLRGHSLASRTYFSNSSEISNYGPMPSAMDTLGYAALRSLQQNRIKSSNVRHHRLTDESLSFNGESSDGESSVRDSLSLSFRGSRNFSEVDNDADSSYEDSSSEEPRYLGISLPTCLSYLFLDNDNFVQPPNHHLVKNRGNISDSDQQDKSIQNGENVFEFHNSSNCLKCSFTGMSEIRDRSSSHGHIKDSNLLDTAGKNMSEDSLSSMEKFEGKEKKQANLLEPYFPSYASSSPDTKTGSLPKNLKILNLVEIRKEVIRSVSYLIGWLEVIKLAEQGLLNLKQKYPVAFQDICLYSEISMQLASYNFRLPARRFLQELFMDLSFDQLYPDVESIYERNRTHDLGNCKYSE